MSTAAHRTGNETLAAPNKRDRSDVVTAQTTPAAYKPKSPTAIEFAEEDNHLHIAKERGDSSQRTITYAIFGGSRFILASAARVAVLKVIYSLSAAQDVLALSSVEVDISSIPPGESKTIKWRGKPVFLRHLTQEELDNVNGQDIGALRDAQPHMERVDSTNPAFVVMMGVCTHLGCVPIANAGLWNGYFCPCHGSHYDASGRIMQGPAPLNLEIPSYRFADETTLVVG